MNVLETHVEAAGPAGTAPPPPAPPPSPATGGSPPETATDYRALLERIPAVSYLAGFGEAGRWEYVSPQIEGLLGFAPHEWRDDPELWFRQIHPDDRASALEDEMASKASGQPLHSEYRLRTKEGRIVWVLDEAVLVKDIGGTPLYWQGFMYDISGRKITEGALEESESRYHSLFENVPVGLYRTTPTGGFEEGNRALARILGYPDRTTLLSADAFEFYVEPSDRERWMAMMAAEGTVNDFELQLRRRDGSVIWVRDSARAIRDPHGNVLFYEGVVQDITRQKQAEWEARQAHQQLSGWISELERRNREMSSIKQMGDMLQTCPTAEEAYNVMAHWAGQLFPGRSGALCVISPSRNMVEPVAIWGEPVLGESVFGPEECWGLRTGRPHVVEDPKSRLVCRHLTEPLAGPSMCVPMMAQGEALGVLHLQLEAGAIVRFATAGDQGGAEGADQVVVAVAEHLALALANLRLRDSLRTQSIRDPLTGLFNRRYMEESLDREFRRAERRKHPVGVIMLDLDHFNHFNNTFGHQAGDTLLHAFGELLRTHIRAEDIACRYGGEEFVLILPEASLDIVLQRAEMLRQETRDLHVQQRGQALGTVTVSIGVAAYPDHGGTVESLIRAADQAMYRAKNAGRDRTVVFTPD